MRSVESVESPPFMAEITWDNKEEIIEPHGSPTSAMRCSDRHIFGLVLRSLATSRQRPFAQHAAHNSANAQ